MFTLVQKRYPYTGNLNSEMPGDSENTYLSWRDGLDQLNRGYADAAEASLSPQAHLEHDSVADAYLDTSTTACIKHA